MVQERQESPATRKPSYLGWFLVCLSIYVAAVTAYGVYSYGRKRAMLMGEIDRSLQQAAVSLKYMLAPDFHDRALGPGAIGFEEELRNRRAVSEFTADARFKWTYTLVEKDGKFYFSAPTVSAEEARERTSWYFYPYDDIPPEFVRALASGQPAYVNYTDQWGRFRSIALPQKSPGGHPYLACADMEISHVQSLLRRDLVETLLTILFFLGCSLPFIALFHAHAARLRVVNSDLARHRDHLEELVRERTRELEAGQQELRTALAEVRTLSGLLPMCSSCKKIRDDQGCWNTLEGYVEAHSEAEFTHGMCPDCARRLYPEYPL